MVMEQTKKRRQVVWRIMGGVLFMMCQLSVDRAVSYGFDCKTGDVVIHEKMLYEIGIAVKIQIRFPKTTPQ